jgi:hypothetical protein
MKTFPPFYYLRSTTSHGRKNNIPLNFFQNLCLFLPNCEIGGDYEWFFLKKLIKGRIGKRKKVKELEILMRESLDFELLRTYKIEFKFGW